MTDHTDMPEPTGADADAPLESWFQALADDYNRPPPAPREAMWARIHAARSADGAGDGDAAGDAADAAAVVVVAAGMVRAVERAGGEDDLARRRAGRGGNGGGGRGRSGGGPGVRAWSGPTVGVAAAAALALAAGLAWWTRTPAAATATTAAAPTVVAAAPAPSAGAVADAVQASPAGPDDAVAVAADARPAGSAAGSASVGATARPRQPATATPTARLAVNRDAGRREDGAAAGASAERDVAGAPYRLAAVQYLGQAEALLTVFRAGATRDAADPSLQPWARELLTTTRLLLDSPAARDPRLGALLDELEPVLVQIVQLPAARAAEERRLIARSIERSDLMTQLRSAVPAGPAVPQRAGE